MDADPIPAVREEDATGEVAAVFADLRETLRIPFVNLFWRHLATQPDALAALWATVRPLYVGPDLPPQAAGLRAAATWPGDLALPLFAWDAGGVGRAARAEIAALIADYETGNSFNYLALLAARGLLRGETGAPPGLPPAAPSSVEPPLAAPAERARPLPALGDLAPDCRALVLALDRFARPGTTDAVASLYRHLAYWPAFLALAYARLAPLHEDGRLAAALARIEEQGRGVARTHLLGRLDPTRAVALAAEQRTFVVAALDEFTRLMIGRMVVMGAALRALLPDEA